MADIDDFDDEEERKRRPAASAPEFTAETIAAAPWTAVYYSIPLGAGPALLRQGYDAAMQCAGAVAGPPGLSMHAFEPMQGELGADKTREENFEHAVRRLDELNSRLRPAILDDEAERQAPEQDPAAEKEPMTIEAIERDPSNAVKLDIPQDASLELLEHARKAAAHQVDVIKDYIQYDQEDFEDGAFEDLKAAQARIAELDERLEPAISPADEMSRPLDAVARLRELENERDRFVIGAPDGTETHDPEEWGLQNPEDAEELERLEGSRPLGAAELAERVRRIIENPHLEGAEQDDGVLQALAEQREELGLAEPARQDDAPQVDSSQEPETQSSADRDAAEIDYLFGQQEMTEAKSAAYDRFTGQELSPRAGQSAGPVQEPGQSQSQTRARSR